MQRDPSIGLAGDLLARRRDRTEFPFMRNRRQTLGHNLLTGLVDFWSMSAGANSGFVSGVHTGKIFTNAATLSLAAGNGPTLATVLGGVGSLCFSRAFDASIAVTAGVGYSVCGWVYPTTIQAAQYIYSQVDGTNVPETALLFTPTNTYFRAWGSGGDVIVASGSALNANAWNFVVGVYNPSVPNVGIYINGGAPTTASAANAPAQSTLTHCIGGGAVTGNTAYTVLGRIQRVGIWKRVLTADEITYLYNGGFGRDYPFI